MFSKLSAKIPASFKEKLFFLGPAIILGVETSGKTGITEIMGVGAEYGFALLWVIVLTVLFKFAFANGIARYTVATGTHIFDGLRTIPGPKNWEVFFITVIYFLEMIGFGAIAVLAGMFLAALFPGMISAETVLVLSLAIVLLILWKESYERFERVIAGIAAVMIVGAAYSILALHGSLPLLGVGSPLLIPDDALMETLALMGAVGAGLNILLYSIWLHEKVGDRHGETYFRDHLKSINLDLGIAFILVIVVACVFLALGAAGAASLQPETGHVTNTEIIEGIKAVLDTIPYGAEVFLCTGYVVLLGAVISGMDGRARAISSIARSTLQLPIEDRTLYRALLLVFSAIILGMMVIEHPIEVIHTVWAIASIMFAFLGFMLIYLDSRLPAYARGSRLWVLVMGAGSVVFLFVALMMEESFLTFGLPLIERIALLVLVLYAFSKTETFRRALSGRMALEDRAWLVLVFGVLSLYGSYRGIAFDDLIINFRDLGPMIAGLLGGPIVGGLAGAIGGAFRATQGGFTAVACSIATVAAGIIAGLYRRLWRGDLSYLKLVLLAFIVETIHILVIVPLFTPFSSAAEYIAMVHTTWLPMTVSNSVGLILFLYILRERGLELVKEKECEVFTEQRFEEGA